MHVWSVQEELPPIRLLRPVGALHDAELRDFLRAASSLELAQGLAGTRSLHVFDCRRFAGLELGQRRACEDWLISNLDRIRAASVALALVAPGEVVDHSRVLLELLDSAGVRTQTFGDLDDALHWTLDQAFDCDEYLSPRLAMEGVAAFRETLS